MRFSKQLSGLLFIVLLSAAILPSLALCIRAEDTSASDGALQVSDYNEQMKVSVEAQIRAFAKSINQAGADDAAAKALAKHGLTGGGKKLSVGKNHPLTATLWNSELFQAAAADTCAAAITYMQMLDKDYLPYVNGFCIWRDSSSFYGAYVCLTETYYESSVTETGLSSSQYTGKRNSFDFSLDWMAGTTAIKLSFQRKKVTTDAVTYSVTCSNWDRFDFSTSNNSGFKNLISGIGALLFREFDWEATVTFELTVPYSCDHSTNNYHWTYDATNRLLTSDNSNGYTENGVTRLTYQEYAGATGPYCHKLDKPVRLYHDKPWVMEYTIRKLGNFVLAPWYNCTRQQPYLMNYATSGLLFQQRNVVNNQTTYDCYGTYYDGLLSQKTTYTFRLENEMDAKGNNMVYLTIVNADNQTTVLNKVPMDDYYENVGGVLSLKNASSNYWNGTDFFISYIGIKNYSFHADYFDLKIWENGIDGDDGEYFTSKVTAPTCSSQGYTTYTCTCCGYSYKDTYTAKTEHQFGSWQKTAAPTCVNEGVETRTCTGCGTAETRPIAAAGHSYLTAVTKPTCTEDGYTTHTCSVCKDRYIDTYVDAKGHSYGEWSQANAPTCTAEGEETRTCAGCTAFEARKVTATGHSHVSSVTAPTCTEGGYTTHTCHCGDTYVDGNVSAIGHRHSAWIVDTQPQVGTQGSKHIECTVCRAVLQTESIEALPEPETETEPETTPKPEETKDNEGIAGKIVIGAISFLVLCFAGYLLLHKKRKK